MHCFEGPEWLYLRRGRENFPTGPLVKVDPQGRCAGVLVYGLQMIVLKASQVSLSFYILINNYSYLFTLKDKFLRILGHGHTLTFKNVPRLGQLYCMLLIFDLNTEFHLLVSSSSSVIYKGI